MRALIQIAIALLSLIALFLGIIYWKTVPQLNFAERGMGWEWQWSYFEPFSNGIQVTRTQDTRQLLLRRVYLKESVVVFFGTTLDNKFEFDVVNQDNCVPESHKWISVSVNSLPISEASMVCEASGKSYIYRFVANKLSSVEFRIGDDFIREDFSQWPVSEIKTDQFKQQHSAFFNKQTGSNEHQWLRD